MFLSHYSCVPTNDSKKTKQPWRWLSILFENKLRHNDVDSWYSQVDKRIELVYKWKPMFFINQIFFSTNVKDYQKKYNNDSL